MDTTTKIRNILKALEARFMPAPGSHHNFTYRPDLGGVDTLRLNLSWRGVFRPIDVNEGDLDKPIDQIITEIAVLVGVN